MGLERKRSIVLGDLSAFGYEEHMTEFFRFSGGYGWDWGSAFTTIGDVCFVFYVHRALGVFFYLVRGDGALSVSCVYCFDCLDISL